MLTIPDTPQDVRSDDALQGAWGAVFERAAACNKEIGSAFADWSEEYLKFLQRRGAEDIGLVSQLGSCKTPVELMQAYQAFFLKASQDYRDECAVLARISKRALDSWTNLRPDAART